MTSRRALLAALGTTLSLAGCAGDSADPNESTATTRTTARTRTATETTSTAANTTQQPTTTEQSTTTETTTATTTDRDPPESAVASGIADEPTLGPNPWDANAAVVLFSDPSCPYCQRWERDTYPDLVPHVERNELSVVYRSWPVVADWGVEALHALDATYERSEDAFWGLRTWLYHNPGRVSSDPAGAAFGYLQDETNVDDPREVMKEAKNEQYAARLSEDESVARELGLEGVPGFVLVKEGKVVTKLSGASPYSTFRALLGLG